MKQNKMKEKVYHSIEEVDKEFFPVILKKEQEDEERRDPKKLAERLAKEFKEKIMKEISK